MTAKNKWVPGIVIVMGLVILFLLPALWHIFLPYYGHGLLSGYQHMPMLAGYYGRGGFGLGFMSFGMLFVGLISLGLLGLIGLGIAALIKYLRTKPAV